MALPGQDIVKLSVGSRHSVFRCGIVLVRHIRERRVKVNACCVGLAPLDVRQPIVDKAVIRFGVILECTYLSRSIFIIVEVIVRFADGLVVCIGEADIGARVTRNLDCVRDFSCGNRFNVLLLTDLIVFITIFFVERYFDTGEFVLRFVFKRHCLAAVENVLSGDIGIGFQAVGVPGFVCAIYQACIKDMTAHIVNIQPCVSVLAYRAIHFYGMAPRFKLNPNITAPRTISILPPVICYVYTINLTFILGRISCNAGHSK